MIWLQTPINRVCSSEKRRVWNACFTVLHRFGHGFSAFWNFVSKIRSTVPSLRLGISAVWCCKPKHSSSCKFRACCTQQLDLRRSSCRSSSCYVGVEGDFRISDNRTWRWLASMWLTRQTFTIRSTIFCWRLSSQPVVFFLPIICSKVASCHSVASA